MALEKLTSNPNEIRFDFLPSSPLENGWVKVSKTDVTPTFSIPAQGAMSMKTGGQVFAMDYLIPQSAKNSSYVSFQGRFDQGAIFYTEVEVSNAGSSQVEYWWFAHVLGGKSLAPKKESDSEWKFYVFPGDGKTFDFDLKQEVAQVLSGKTYRGISRIRLRGDISLWPIQLGDKDTRSWWTFRKPWKSWTRADKLTLLGIVIAIILAAVGTLVTIYLPELRIRLGLDKPKVESNAPPPGQNSKPETKLLIAESAASVQEMRRRHHVSLISPMEADKTTREIQPNSFGFTFATPIINRSPIEIQVESSKRSFEIHKLGDSALLVVGYVGPETFIRLREGVGTDADVTLYSSPIKEASGLVALPLNRLKCPRGRYVQTAIALDCKVTD
jgi:hypothetical protein